MGTRAAVSGPALVRNCRPLADVQRPIGSSNSPCRSYNIAERVAHSGRQGSRSGIHYSRLRRPHAASFGSDPGAAASMIGNSFGSEIAGPCADFQGLTSLVFRRDFHGAIGTVMSEIARNVGDRVLPADGSGNAWPNLAQIGGSRGKIRLASRDLCDFF